MTHALLGSLVKQERKSDQIDESPHVGPPVKTVVTGGVDFCPHQSPGCPSYPPVLTSDPSF